MNNIYLRFFVAPCCGQAAATAASVVAAGTSRYIAAIVLLTGACSAVSALLDRFRLASFALVLATMAGVVVAVGMSEFLVAGMLVVGTIAAIGLSNDSYRLAAALFLAFMSVGGGAFVGGPYLTVLFGAVAVVAIGAALAASYRFAAGACFAGLVCAAVGPLTAGDTLSGVLMIGFGMLGAAAVLKAGESEFESLFPERGTRS